MFSNKCPIVKCFQLNNRLLIPSQSFLLLRSELLLSYQYHHILFDKVQRNRSNSILRYGDETQEAWKPLLNMLPVLRGSSEWLAQLESERFLLWLVLTQPLSFAKQK